MLFEFSDNAKHELKAEQRFGRDQRSLRNLALPQQQRWRSVDLRSWGMLIAGWTQIRIPLR